MKPTHTSPRNRHAIPVAVSACALAAFGLVTSCCSTPNDGRKGRPTLPAANIDFATDIGPTFEIRCLECHNRIGAARNGGLSLETRLDALTSGRHAPVIRPGNSAGSYLIDVINLGHFDFEDIPEDKPAMPPTPDRIWPDEIEFIAEWIDRGAEWPEDVRLVRPQDWAR